MILRSHGAGSRLVRQVFFGRHRNPSQLGPEDRPDLRGQINPAAADGESDALTLPADAASLTDVLPCL